MSDIIISYCNNCIFWARDTRIDEHGECTCPNIAMKHTPGNLTCTAHVFGRNVSGAELADVPQDDGMEIFDNVITKVVV